MGFLNSFLVNCFETNSVSEDEFSYLINISFICFLTSLRTTVSIIFNNSFFFILLLLYYKSSINACNSGSEKQASNSASCAANSAPNADESIVEKSVSSVTDVQFPPAASQSS